VETGLLQIEEYVAIGDDAAAAPAVLKYTSYGA
jgi:hypothetical protein